MTNKEQTPAPVRTLREWRTQVYFESQAEFALRLGVDTSVLSLWETNKRSPRFKTRREVADKLGIQPGQILWPEGKELPVAA